MLKLVSTILFLFLFCTSNFAQVFVRIANVSADTGLSSVDVWIDTTKAVNNLKFRYVSEWIELDTLVTYTLSVCPKNSIDTSSKLADFVISENQLDSQLLLFNAIASAGHSNPSSSEVFAWPNYPMNSETSGYTNVSIFNAISDFEKIDLVENTVLNANIADDLEFNQFTANELIESLNYSVLFQDSANDKTFRELNFNLAERNLTDSAAYVVCTGFLDRGENNNGKALEVAIIPDSAGMFLQLDNQTALIQVINNSFDASLDPIDIYVGTSRVADDVSFREATIYLDVIAGLETNISIAPGTSTSINDTILSQPMQLSFGDKRQFIINGANNTSVTPYQPLGLVSFDTRFAANIGYNIDIALVHGSPDAGTIDINEFDILEQDIFSNTNYNEVEEYASIAAANYQINLISGSDTLKTYQPQLATDASEAYTWVISGIADSLISTPQNEVGIWVAKQSGGNLVELGQTSSIPNIDVKQACRVFPNPSSDRAYINCFNIIDGYTIYDTDGRKIKSNKGSQNQIDLTGIPAGFYQINILTEDGLVARKLVVVDQ